MKFALPATVLTLLLGVVDAAHLEVHYRVQPLMPVNHGAVYHIGNDGNRVYVDALIDGCKRNKGDISEICLDKPRTRAHVIYKSGIKRCFRETERIRYGVSCGLTDICYTWKYGQVACTW